MSVPTVANLGQTGEPTHTVGSSAVAALLVDYTFEYRSDCFNLTFAVSWALGASCGFLRGAVRWLIKVT
ncbi:MAG TPA: hypothetical protein VNE63_20360 [Candidatus Acidoferrales bacterium]|nr:hypothetical protein [Candidatus Acidoferrales bacterium]